LDGSLSHAPTNGASFRLTATLVKQVTRKRGSRMLASCCWTSAHACCNTAVVRGAWCATKNLRPHPPRPVSRGGCGRVPPTCSKPARPSLGHEAGAPHRQPVGARRLGHVNQEQSRSRHNLASAWRPCHVWSTWAGQRDAWLVQ